MGKRISNSYENNAQPNRERKDFGKKAGEDLQWRMMPLPKDQEN